MKSLQKYFYALAIVLFTTGTIAQNLAKTNPVITKDYEGSIFTSEKSLVDNISQSNKLSFAHTIFANPELTELTKEASYTVFLAPDSFFNKMDEEERDAFLATSNTYVQKQVFSTFIVPGRIDSRSLMHELEKRKGEPLYLKTIGGKNLGVKMHRKKMVLFDTEGNQVKLVQSDYYHSKGFFHIVDGYFMPEGEE